ncbi:MAG: hypothetical protein Q7S19_02560 [bacterium]|nr:hypothetical protein [bacterium]
MDKITKALRKFSEDEKLIVKDILRRVYNGDVAPNLDLKKLSGYDDIFRIKKGKIRIIYLVNKDDSIKVLSVTKRNDNTYNKF